MLLPPFLFVGDEKWKPGYYIGASHIAHEYIGGEMTNLKITFCEPSELLDTSRFAAFGVTAVCARIYLLDIPDMQVATLIHFVRDMALDVKCGASSGLLSPVPTISPGGSISIAWRKWETLPLSCPTCTQRAQRKKQ